MKTNKLNINVNIGLMSIILVGIAICVFLTSRDFYYAIDKFFGLHEDESKMLLNIASYGFEVAILIYALTNKESAWKDYVFVAASCIVNSSYLWYSANQKEGAIWAHYVCAVVLGCVFPLIVVWLSVLFRAYFWETVKLKQSAYNEVVESEKLKIENETHVQANEVLKAENKTHVQANTELKAEVQKHVQENAKLKAEMEKHVQANEALKAEKEKCVQSENKAVQELKSYESTCTDTQKDYAKAIKDKELAEQATKLLKEKHELVLKMEQGYKDEIKRLQAQLQTLSQRKPTLKVNGNIDLQASLLRRYKEFQNKDDSVAQQALSNYVDLVEKSITLTN